MRGLVWGLLLIVKPQNFVVFYLFFIWPILKIKFV